MEHIIIFIHVIAALSVIVLILVQQGKGAEIGASFGSGASSALLGPSTGGNFFTHATAILVTVFFITSLSLAVIAHRKVNAVLDEGIPSEEVINSAAAPVSADAQPAAVTTDVPVAPAAAAPVATAAPAGDVPVAPPAK